MSATHVVGQTTVGSRRVWRFSRSLTTTSEQSCCSPGVLILQPDPARKPLLKKKPSPSLSLQLAHLPLLFLFSLLSFLVLCYSPRRRLSLLPSLLSRSYLALGRRRLAAPLLLFHLLPTERS